MGVLYAINPTHKRRRKSGHKRHRSAAQKAATRRMLAANRNPSRKRRASASAPAVHHRRRRAVSHRRSARRSSRRSMVPRMTGVMGLLKAGAIGGAGAVGVDILMGYASKVLPASMQTPLDANGNMNLGYFGAKGALAVALGLFGRRIMPAPIAAQMAEGALTVMAYTLIRPMVPASIALGYINPAPVNRGMGKYVSNAGAYQQIPVRSGTPATGKGARASQVLSMVTSRRVA